MFKLSLTKQILLAIFVGSLMGVLLGPLCSVFQPIGKAFLMFIQMVILLYIPCSIIHGLGSTRRTVARTLFKKGWVFLFFIWVLILLSVYLMNFLFPRMNILFAGSGAHSSFEINFLNYLVPENPLYDIVNNVVPAIAIFAIIIGVAVMHLTHKEPLISFLERINNTMEQVLKGIMAVSPIGVFAIFASFMGNIRVKDLASMNLYILPMVIIAVVITFWVLPALVISCTSLKYRDVIQDIRSTCFLAFVIGSPSIAIPFLYRVVERHAEAFEIKDKEFHSTAQMIVPIAYTFTQVGNLFVLFFVMFLSYFFGLELGGFEQGLIGMMSILMSFGGPELAINSVSFLTSTLGFPETSMQLYDTSSLITQNFQILISVASMCTFVILLLLGYYKRLTFRPSQFFRHFFLYFFFLVVSVFSTKYLITTYNPMENPSPKMKIESNYRISPSAKVYKIGYQIPDLKKRSSIENTLERIYDTKKLVVGYHPNLPPFSYFNDAGELVGYNIAFAYKLAYDMNVNLVFVPFYYHHLGEMLRDNLFDIAMSPVLLAEATVGNMNFPHYYLTSPNVFIVPREKKEDYHDFNHMKENPYLVVGVMGFYKEVLNRILPNAESFSIDQMDRIKSFMTSGQIDAMLWTKEQALDYCRKNPEYVVVDYGEQGGFSYLAYPVKYDALAFIFFLNRWMTIQEHIGFKKEQYQYWMNGQPPEKRTPRWSVIRNVLGIVK